MAKRSKSENISAYSLAGAGIIPLAPRQI